MDHLVDRGGRRRRVPRGGVDEHGLDGQRGVVGRCQRLRNRERARVVVHQDQVRERAADVRADPPHQRPGNFSSPKMSTVADRCCASMPPSEKTIEPGHVLRVVRGQEDRRAGHVLGRADARQRHVGAALAALFLRQALGVDRARHQRADAHAVGAEVERQRAGEGLDAALGRVVGRVAAVRLRGAAGREVDHHAGALRAHQLRGAHGGVVRAGQVDADDRVPPVVVGLQEVTLGGGQGGVVDEDVELREPLDRGREQAVAVVARRDVAAHGERGVERRGHRLGGVAVDVGDDDARALGGVALGDRAADPAGAAGDDRDLAAQTAIRHSCSPICR